MKFFHIVIVAVLVLSIFIVALPTRHANASTITVPDNYPTIQAAINAVSDGDTVFVRSGAYSEHLGIGKSISLVGENSQTTKIDGEEDPAISVVGADSFLVQGFTLTSSLAIRQGLSVVELQLCNNIIIRNSVMHGIAGAYRGQPGWSVNGIGLTVCHNVTIMDNWIGDFDYGVALVDSAENMIRGNLINNTWVGIGLSDDPTVNNLVQNNNITYTGAIHWGEYYPPFIPFSGIEVTNNASGNLFEHNRITNCYCGVTLESAMDNTFTDNLIMSNGYSYYLLTNPDAPQVDVFGDNDIWIATHKKYNPRDWWSTLPSTGNMFYHNYLEKRNKIHVTSGNNSWNNGYPSGGNY